LYYHKSAAGKEIDLIFEIGNNVHAVEIKVTSHPASKDINNLHTFARKM
jgi:hypothetical protein